MIDMLIYGWKPRPRRSGLLAAAISWLAVLPAGAAQAQDWVWANRESAQTAAMHDIAVIQASIGDFQGAKRTVSQIGEEGEKMPAQVTVVSFCNGQPICCTSWASCGRQSPMAGAPARLTPGWGAVDAHGTQYFLALDRAADRPPAKLPADLPASYLNPDPRHGPVVDFTDERDAYGTRVTSRKYADGYVVIETPRAKS